ncbi:MAG: WD40 repeat domain-containing protein [Singulisphaera sp.]
MICAGCADRRAVRALALSQDGRRLATGGSDALVRCWKVPDPVEGAWIRSRAGSASRRTWSSTRGARSVAWTGGRAGSCDAD